MNTEEIKTEETEAVIRRYPLWESCLERLRQSQLLSFGSKIRTDWLAEHLGCDVNTLEFGAALSCINDEIIGEGYYLSARDQGGLFYMVVPPDRAEEVAGAYIRKSFRQIKRGIKLYNGLLQNPTANLPAEARRRIESLAEKNAIRLLLMQKPLTFFKPEHKQPQLGS